jgi:hypothetical protein
MPLTRRARGIGGRDRRGGREAPMGQPTAHDAAEASELGGPGKGTRTAPRMSFPHGPGTMSGHGLG